MDEQESPPNAEQQTKLSRTTIKTSALTKSRPEELQYLAGRLHVLLHRQEELELRRQFFLGVQAVGEIDAADAAVRVQLNAQRLDVVGTVRAARKVAQVELDLVPAGDEECKKF